MVGMLNLRQLSYFTAAAETGSFVSAGRSLNVSANSIVHAVNTLETQLDCRLFKRKASHGLIITEDGERLLQEAFKLLASAQDLEEQFTKQDALTGEIIVGCLDSLAWSLAPLLIEYMGRIHPEISIRLKITATTSIVNIQDIDGYDLLLTFSDGSVIEGFDEDVFLEVQPFVMMARDHPLSQHPSLSIEYIEPYPLIVLDTGPRDSYFLDMFRKLGMSPIIGLRTSSSIVSWSLVSVSQMIAIRHLKPLTPASPVGKDVLCLPLEEDLPSLNISMLSNQRVGKNKKNRITAFRKTTKHFFKEGLFDEYVLRKTPTENSRL